jgi:hypothetical protein
MLTVCGQNSARVKESRGAGARLNVYLDYRNRQMSTFFHRIPIYLSKTVRFPAIKLNFLAHQRLPSLHSSLSPISRSHTNI